MARNKETVTLCNMCMVYDDDKILVIDRVDPDWSGIALPGGHVEDRESFTDSVIREVFEETGLTISSPQLCGMKDWPEDDGSRYICLFYKTRHFSGEIKSSEEGKVFWVKKDEVLSLPLASDMEDMLKVFWDDDLSEFFYYKKDGRWAYDLK